MNYLLRFLTLSVLLSSLWAVVPAQASADKNAQGSKASHAGSAAKVSKLPQGNFDYQLGGPREVPASVATVVRDRQAKPAAGKYNICYINGFQTQPNEANFWKNNASLLLRKNGKLVNDGAWNETLLDIRTDAKRKALAKIMQQWVNGCASKGFKAVEFDNLDSYTRSKKTLTRGHMAAYAKLLTAAAHRKNLAVAQKNLAEWNGKQANFDFAIAEECGEWQECGSYTKYYGNQVLLVEYTSKGFSYACENFGAQLPIVKRDLLLKPSFTPTYC